MRRWCLEAQNLILDRAHDLLIFLVIFEEIGNVQEGIAFQANVHERRLHAGKHPRNPAFMNTTRQRVFLLALKINFDKLIVFEYRHASLVAIRGNH
jgi:hypothetical protein